MLHEVLLSLSGYNSPLFEHRKDGTVVDDTFPLLQPSEKALLSKVGHLSRLHRDLKAHTRQIRSSHASIVCRAAATSLETVHLKKFQQKILAVEQRILSRDPSLVGAYSIVPLATVVGEFDAWTRRLEWYWKLACYMLPLAHSPKRCRDHALIDWLRQESQTGYPDVEEAALSLGADAEKTWLRQVSSWVLYGKLPTIGTEDFFIQRKVDTEDYESDVSRAPGFMSAETASSILFIGKSLNIIRDRSTHFDSASPRSRNTTMDLLPQHLSKLSELRYPLSSASLHQAIQDVRLSLSRNALSELLPLPKVVDMLELLREFFLLGRGEFAVCLVAEADERLRSRSRAHTSATSTKLSDSLKGVLPKEGEVNAMLAKTWSALSSYEDFEDSLDDNLELAREMIKLTVSKQPVIKAAESKQLKLPVLANVSFADVLLPVPTTLTLEIKSPYDLFIDPKELQIYSTLFSYMLAIRRAQIHLSDLWRETSMRRERPIRESAQARKSHIRSTKRHREMRKVWATCGAAIFLLSELGEYFEGQVVNETWVHLKGWILTPTAASPSDTSKEQPNANTVDTLTATFKSSTLSTVSHHTTSQGDPPPRDPELLATAHRRFLSALAHGLLLTDSPSATLLRALLTDVDALVGHMHRLQVVEQNLDLEEDEGVTSGLISYRQERAEVVRDLDRARKRVDAGLKGVVRRLREVDLERDNEAVEGEVGEEGAYVPLRGPGVERLLMKLEFGIRANDEGEEEDGELPRRDLI